MVNETPKDTPSDYAQEQAQIRILNEALPRRVTEADLAQHERPADREVQESERAVLAEERLRRATEIVDGLPATQADMQVKKAAPRSARTRQDFEPRRGQFND